ncbi:MAG: PDR/VanB family oxidoreductase [Burkholderiaceae bacterium]
MNAPEQRLLQVRVAAKTPVAASVCRFDLVSLDGSALPAFSAGAHVDVHLGNDGAVVRQYSLCNPPGETHRYQIGVLRDAASRGGSATLHDQVHEGQVLTIGAPRNHFPLVAGARRSLLLAGGIGITPLLAMAAQLSADGEDFALHVAARSRAQAPFAAQLTAAPYAERVHLHLDDGPAEQRLDLPALLAAPAAGTHLYVCGPQGFMEAVLATARAQGWPETQLHWEFFANAAATAPRDSDEAFEVELARSGQVVAVPRGQSIVQALTAAGVSVMTSCEQGVCGTCLTRVTAGVPDHRDAYLTPDEQAANDQVLLCCSRARTARLVLDL